MSAGAAVAPPPPLPRSATTTTQPPATGDPLAAARALAAHLAVDAAARDHAGGTAWHARDLIREAGLLRAAIPVEHGGGGRSWPVVLRAVRAVAEVDPSVAHVLAFHYVVTATCELFGTPAQSRRFYRETARDNLFWGNALNPRDRGLTLGEDGRLRGKKSFCTGATGSDRLLLSALAAGDGRLVVAAIPTARAGVRILDDWDGIGQRQTDSGTVELDGVAVAPDEILGPPGPLGSPFASLRPLLAQLVLTNLLAGIARGALDAALAFARAQQPATVPLPPFVARRLGEAWTRLAASEPLVDRAAVELEALWSRGAALTAAERGALAVPLAAAKVQAAETALEVTGDLFQIVGARGTDRALGLDRFWRNARTLTLHDRNDDKLEAIGRSVWSGEPPAPSFYI